MKILLPALAAAALALGGNALAASHYGGTGPEAALRLDPGQKWRTDEALREGMENIRAALFAERHIFHGGDDSETDYGALAARVTGELALIVQNSRLDPLADAELHKLVGQMVAGAETMQGRERGTSPRAGAERIAEALADYVRMFDHAGW